MIASLENVQSYLQTGLQCDFTYNTFNDYVRLYVLKWCKHNKYKRHYDDLAYTYACWFICREVTMRLYMLLYYRKQLSDPAYDFAKTLRSFKTFLYNDFMKMYRQDPKEFSKCFNKVNSLQKSHSDFRNLTDCSFKVKNDVDYQITYISNQLRYIMSGINYKMDIPVDDHSCVYYLS